MNEKDLLVWAAGALEGGGIIACTIEQGPSREYAAITLFVRLNNSDQIRRLMIAANNGSVARNPLGFELGGYAAVRGFLERVWPYLTPIARKTFNAELKKYKSMKRAPGFTRS